MQASRKGRRVNDPGVDGERLRNLMRGLRKYIAPEPGNAWKDVTIKGLAREVGVSDRTLRRWLAGEDWPPADKFRRLLTRARLGYKNVSASRTGRRK